MNVMVSVAFLALYMAEVGLNKTYLEVLPLNVVRDLMLLMGRNFWVVLNNSWTRVEIFLGFRKFSFLARANIIPF